MEYLYAWKKPMIFKTTVNENWPTRADREKIVFLKNDSQLDLANGQTAKEVVMVPTPSITPS